MLQSMREGAGAKVLKIFLMSFLVLAVGGLVLSDVGGFFRSGVPANTVAKGGGVNIGAMQFDQTVRRVLAPQGVTPQEAFQRGLVHMILNSEIQRQLLTQRAHDLGLRASDDTVSAQLAKIAQEISPAGGGNKSDTLKQILRSQGISESEFIESIRQETANNVLQSVLSSGGAVVPAALADDLYKAQSQTRDIQAITLKFSVIKDFDAPDEESLTKFYEANKVVHYAIPETRTVTIATLNAKMIEDKIEITDEELKASYDSHIDTYTKPESRRVQQAIFTTKEDAAKAIAAVKAGKTLKEAATKNFIGEESYQESGLLKEIGGPVFDAKEKDVVGPIETPLGQHVMFVSAVLPPQVEPFDKVKKSIRDEILNVRMMDDMLAAGNDIDDRLASGEDLDVIVKDMGLTTQKIGPFRANGLNAAGKDQFADYGTDRQQIIEAAFDAEKGEAAPVIETADGRFLAVRVDDASALSYKPYEEVKESLRKQWIEEQQKVLNQARARDAHKKLQEGADLDTIAKNLGVSVQTYNKVSRDSAAPKGLGPVAVTRLFSVGKNDYILAEQEDGISIAAVTAIDFPTATSDKARAETEAALKGTLKTETLTLFVDNLSTGGKVKINEALLQQMYAQPIGGQ